MPEPDFLEAPELMDDADECPLLIDPPYVNCPLFKEFFLEDRLLELADALALA